MDPTTTTDAADEDMPDTSSIFQQRPGRISRSIGQLRTSRYTTGLLTPSSFIPQDNSSWQVLRTAGFRNVGDSAADSEVEELFKCQDEERSPNLGRGTISYQSDIDKGSSEDQVTDTLSIPEQYFDYDAYFRHSGWTGCASIQQNVVAESTSAMSPIEASLAASHNPAVAHEGASKDHVVAIHAPVDQFGSTSIAAGGMTTRKAKALYHPDETAWLLLLSKKVKAAADMGRKIRNPGPAAITPPFNEFFEGRILQNEHGEDLPPREAREELSIKGKIMKLNTEIWELRDVTRKLLEGSRGGHVYVPDITAEELRQFQADGTVQSGLP